MGCVSGIIRIRMVLDKWKVHFSYNLKESVMSSFNKDQKKTGNQPSEKPNAGHPQTPNPQKKSNWGGDSCGKGSCGHK